MIELLSSARQRDLILDCIRSCLPNIPNYRYCLYNERGDNDYYQVIRTGNGGHEKILAGIALNQNGKPKKIEYTDVHISCYDHEYDDLMRQIGNALETTFHLEVTLLLI